MFLWRYNLRLEIGRALRDPSKMFSISLNSIRLRVVVCNWSESRKVQGKVSRFTGVRFKSKTDAAAAQARC